MPDGLDDLLGDNGSTDNPGQGSGGGGLRKQLEDALAREKALNDRLDRMATAQRSRDIEALFAKHAVPELARDLFPADAEPTDEAVTALVEKYGGLWGASAQAARPLRPIRRRPQAAQRLSAQAAPPPVTPMTEDEVRARLDATQTKEEFLAALAELSAAGV
jgi:hypothetical protein